MTEPWNHLKKNIAGKNSKCEVLRAAYLQVQNKKAVWQGLSEEVEMTRASVCQRGL